jgi:hypothetical protein
MFWQPAGMTSTRCSTSAMRMRRRGAGAETWANIDGRLAVDLEKIMTAPSVVSTKITN